MLPVLPLARFQRLLELPGQKEDVDRAYWLATRPGKAPIQLGRGPGRRPAHGARVRWQIPLPGGTCWMFRARNATARLFHRSQSTFRLDGWVFIAECRAGLNRGPGVCAWHLRAASLWKGTGCPGLRNASCSAPGGLSGDLEVD